MHEFSIACGLIDKLHYRGRPKYWEDALSDTPVATLQCPNCGKAVSAIEGQACAIKSVKFLQTEPAAF